ncbi:olfactory receptor 5AR1-like [Vipera latastei]
MTGQNQTQVTDFIFSGFTDHPELQVVLFNIFLIIYIITLSANLGMILLIKIDPQLHTPMYFFLSHLAFLDASYSSTVTPKMLIDLLSETKRISYSACATQLFFYVFFVDIECVLLAVMAYDRYVAICNPLLYSAKMSKMLCQQLIAFAYCIGLMDTIVYTSSTFLLTFCRSNLINHFFCDMPPLFVLSCSDTYVNELVLLILDGFIEACSICMSLISYVYIVVTILRMHSAEGRRKAFSTCASHLTAVGIFHGTIVFMYIRPTSSYSMDQDKWASMFYTVVIPMLNPLIYSLRNKEVKDALTKSVGNTKFQLPHGQMGLYVLHRPDSHSQHFDLQPEEQGGERRFDKFSGQYADFENEKYIRCKDGHLGGKHAEHLTGRYGNISGQHVDF